MIADRFTDTRAPRLWLLAHLELEHGIPTRHIRHLQSDQAGPALRRRPGAGLRGQPVMIPEPAHWPLPPRVYAQETWCKWLCELGFDRVPLVLLQAMTDKGSLLETLDALAYAELRKKGGDARG